MDNFFDSIFASSMSAGGIFAALGCALLIGVATSWICSFRLRSSKGVFITGSIMPMVIAAVFIFSELFLSSLTSTTSSDTSFGARIFTLAVAFGLLRFRSVNAKAEEVIFLFFSIATGFAFGLGYLAYGILIGLALALLYVGITFLPIFSHRKFNQERLLKITIPESLDYTEIFDETFNHYTRESEMVGVKTTNMGSMFKLSYRIILKDAKEEKELLDELRTKNGNLEVSILPYVEEAKRL